MVVQSFTYSLADLNGPGADDIGIAFGEDCYDTIVQGIT